MKNLGIRFVDLRGYAFILFIVIIISCVCLANAQSNSQNDDPKVTEVAGTCALFHTLTITVENYL